MTDEIIENITDIDAGDIISLDVRPILAGGADPLEQILARMAELPPDAILRIEAPFDPVPLRRLLAGRGYGSSSRQISERHWQVFFKKQDMPPLPDLPDLPDFPMVWRDGILEMDLRGLMPPDPLVAVLKVIESGRGWTDDNPVFTVWLNRDPIYLHPELVERQWHTEVIRQDSDGLLIRIIRDKDT